MAKEDKGEKIAEEPQKKRKLSHNSFSSNKFGTTIVHSAKPETFPTPKLMEASMKAVKVEAVQRANEKARKDEE